jgi:DNA-directed RNA polymerase beta subunit
MGGSRLGEMEKDVFYSSGTSAIFAEKFYEHSDSFNIKACKNCGMLAEFNPNPNYSVY